MHFTKSAAETAGWSPEKIAQFVLGHGESIGAPHRPVGPGRFAFLPLPSIEARGGSNRVVGSVRRVIVSSFGDGAEGEVSWAARTLTGHSLVDARTHEVAALLSSAPIDAVVRQYTDKASAWTTVTPVVLPGYDDPAHLRRKVNQASSDAAQKRNMLRRLGDRIDGLLRKAIEQCGLSKTLADHAVIEWSNVGFLAGVRRADQYGVPDHLRRFSKYHVRVEFRDSAGEIVEVPGPLCIGGGRYYGLGLLVRTEIERRVLNGASS